jgi:hypothetical protein
MQDTDMQQHTISTLRRPLMTHLPSIHHIIKVLQTGEIEIIHNQISVQTYLLS